ncbi:hypothetical protein ACQHIV_34825 [Kribbella sp. GL6]|uniref:hypothetical protein n=1 Tax=Kribbella sp. GL6 TaxID=3419765 RepID=UPI003D08EC80
MEVDPDNQAEQADATAPVLLDGGPCRVRVWFGEHAIADYTAEPELALRYADAMRRRFLGLRVTIDQRTRGGGPSPAEHWWEVTPR